MIILVWLRYWFPLWHHKETISTTLLLFLGGARGFTYRLKWSLRKKNIAGDNFEQYKTLSKVNRALSSMWRVWEKHMDEETNKGRTFSKDETIGTGRLWRAFCSGWMTQARARESATSKSAICLSLVSMPSITESSGRGLCSSVRRAWLLSAGRRVHDVLHLGRVTSRAEATEGSPCFEIRRREMNFDSWDRLVPARTSLCCRDGSCFFASEGLCDLSVHFWTPTWGHMGEGGGLGQISLQRCTKHVCWLVNIVGLYV